MQALAQDVKKFLDDRGETAVTVGQFRGTGAFAVNSSAGPNLVRELTRALQALKVDVALRSNVTLVGDFEEAEDEKTQLQVVLLRAELRERKTGKKTELETRFVKNQAALAVDTPMGAREFQRFLIAKHREIIAVVSRAHELDGAKKTALETLRSQYAAPAG